MKRTRIISFIVAVFMITALVPMSIFSVSAADTWDGTAAESFASGNGSAESPYIINTAEQLAFLAVSVNSNADYRGVHVKLNSDIDLGNKPWTPIGVYDWDTYNGNPFEGIFDGGSHTVSGVFVSHSTAVTAGLFGETYNAQIKNLTVTAASVTGTKYVGGIVGNLYGGSIMNCHFEGKVTGSVYYVGGIAGRASTGAVVENCTNAGEIFGNENTGGIVGYYSGTDTVIKGCDNTGAVSGYGTVGGIIGYLTGTNVAIDSCTNSGAVTGTSDPNPENYAYGSNIGGIAGNFGGADISNCSNSGKISGNGSIGGIAGFTYGNVTNCQNTAEIKGQDYVGGIFGKGSSLTAAENCKNTGAVVAVSYVGGIGGYCYSKDIKVQACENTANITGHGNVGGILGDASGEKASVISCKNSGNISATTDPNPDGYSGGDGVGGIVGYFGGSKIYDCHNTGKVSGNDSIGGIIGKIVDGDIITNISYCLNGGEVVGGIESDGTDEGFVGYYVGGIVGSGRYAQFIASNNTASVTGIHEVGGIVGYLYNGSVESCANSGAVSAAKRDRNEKEYLDYASMGGIVGSAYASTVSSCFNTGAVTGENQVGGIAGETETITITNENGEDVTYGTVVTDSFNTGNVTTSEYGGGVIGKSNSSFVTNCYNIGKVSTTAAEDDEYNGIGGLVGYDKSSMFTACYYLEGTAALGVDYQAIIDANGEYSFYECLADAANATKVTAAQMADVATFAGYDFEEIWIMDAESEYPYPELRPYKEDYTLGDINANGEIDSLDYILLKRAFFGTYVLDDTAKSAGDINGNGEIDSLDYILLKRAFFGTYQI